VRAEQCQGNRGEIKPSASRCPRLRHTGAAAPAAADYTLQRRGRWVPRRGCGGQEGHGVGASHQSARGWCCSLVDLSRDQVSRLLLAGRKGGGRRGEQAALERRNDAPQ
jgi:hypothetical protein